MRIIKEYYFMNRFEREVLEPELINEMLKLFDTVTIGINDENGYPYVIPLTFGYEMTSTQLIVYIHFAKRGKKLDLFKKDNRVGLAFSEYNDFPDHPYKGHRHDYRSVMAQGNIVVLDYKDDPVTWEKGYNFLYTCNNREIPPLSNRKSIPAMYIGIITCDLKNVTAKSEFPIRTKEDIPFINVYEVEEDNTPFDLSDIIAARKPKK